MRPAVRSFLTRQIIPDDDTKIVEGHMRELRAAGKFADRQVSGAAVSS
jgi:hypothetical protein